MDLKKYSSLSEATDKLKKMGYTDNFGYCNGKLQSLENERLYDPGDLAIVEYHRFPRESNPADAAVLFVIETKQGNKGTFVSTQGLYAETEVLEFMDKVPIKNRQASKAKDK